MHLIEGKANLIFFHKVIQQKKVVYFSCENHLFYVHLLMIETILLIITFTLLTVLISIFVDLSSASTLFFLDTLFHLTILKVINFCNWEWFIWSTSSIQLLKTAFSTFSTLKTMAKLEYRILYSTLVIGSLKSMRVKKLKIFFDLLSESFQINW
jgi:hypothetical protein